MLIFQRTKRRVGSAGLGLVLTGPAVIISTRSLISVAGMSPTTGQSLAPPFVPVKHQIGPISTNIHTDQSVSQTCFSLPFSLPTATKPHLTYAILSSERRSIESQ